MTTGAILACAAASFAAAGRVSGAEEPDPRDIILAVARSAVKRDGVHMFARGPLERLYKETKYKRRDEVALLLARCYFGLKLYNEAAPILEAYERTFAKSARFLLPAAYWLARTDLERARSAGAAQRTRLLDRARRGFERVLDESMEPAFVEGSRYFRGVAFFEAGDFERALEVFRHIRSQKLAVPYTETESFALYVGRTHLELRNFADAAREFDAFLKKAAVYFRSSPNIPDAHYWLGEARYYLEEWADAARAYRDSRDTALGKRDSDKVERARYALGWALAKLGEKRSRAEDPAGAREAWTEALAEFEELAESEEPLTSRREVIKNASVFESGELLFKLGRYGRAAERMLRLTDPKRHPDHAAAALYIIGESRKALKQLPQAVEALRRALGAGPKGDLERRARIALAEALVDGGDHDQARDVLGPLTLPARSASVRAWARFEMARIARRAAKVADPERNPAAAAGYLARAYEAYLALIADGAALRELPADEVHYWLGRSAQKRATLHRKLGTPDRELTADEWFDRALAAYREVRKLAGWNEWAEKSLSGEAQVYVARGEIGKAASAYEDILSHAGINEGLAPESELDTRIYLARARIELGAPAAARKALGPVLTDQRLAARRDEAAYLTAVAFAREEGNVSVAVERFRAFLDGYPGSEFIPFALEGLGDCLRRLGRHAEAAAQYERSVSDFPDYEHRDRAELAAGNARWAADDVETALAHFRSLFRRGRDDGLRARARLQQAKIYVSKRELPEALELAGEARGTARTGRTAHEAYMLRGGILRRLGRYEEAAGAFAQASADKAPAFRARAKVEEAGTRLAWSRSGQLDRPAEELRRAARTYTAVYYIAPDAGQKDMAIFGAADALVELVSAEEAAGRREAAARELTEAVKLLGLVSEAGKGRAKVRMEEIEGRLQRLGAPD